MLKRPLPPDGLRKNIRQRLSCASIEYARLSLQNHRLLSNRRNGWRALLSCQRVLIQSGELHDLPFPKKNSPPWPPRGSRRREVAWSTFPAGTTLWPLRRRERRGRFALSIIPAARYRSRTQTLAAGPPERCGG